MLSEAKVRTLLEKVYDDNSHVIQQPLATLEINAPVALMQLVAESKLEVLFAILGEDMPQYPMKKR